MWLVLVFMEGIVMEKEKEECRNRIVETVNKIQSIEILKFIERFVSSGYKEERAED